MIQFEQPNEKFIDAAVGLVKDAYNEEREAIPFLPEDNVYSNVLRNSIKNLFHSGAGAIAIENDELVGFMVGFEVEHLFGENRGVYCPLFGHGCKKVSREYLYKEIYRQVAEIWVSNKCTSHAITFFAHDKGTIDLWFWQGFGLRCVDAIRKVEPIKIDKPNINVIKVNVNDIPYLIDIHKNHNAYYRKSPIFMPNGDIDTVQDLSELIDTDNSHIWVAYKGKNSVGYMMLRPCAETFVSEYEKVMNIKSTFVLEGERNSGIGAMLLKAIQNWLIENNYPLCGVDYESINVDGSSFWNKYFKPYTYSLARRIDERILSL